MLLGKVSRKHLVERDGRGERCQGKQQEEYRRPSTRKRHILENLGQGDKYQRSTLRRLQTCAEDSGEDNQSCQHSHEQSQKGDAERSTCEVVILLKIRCVGNHTTHTHREREEGLTDSREDGLGRECRLEIGREEEAIALDSIRHKGYADSHNDEDDEECGHHHLRGLFDTLLHATHDDKVRQQNEDNGIEDLSPRILKRRELCREAIRRGVERAANRAHHILQRPARHDVVVTRDKERANHSVVTQPTPRA